MFTKTEGEEKLKIVLLDRVDEIIDECTVNEKYRLMFKPIPKVGIFTVPGVLFGLHKLMLDEKNEYNGIIEKAYEIFEAAKSDDNYSLTLFQTKAKPAFQDVKKKLPTIMAYRLVLFLKAITINNGKDLIIPVNNDSYREQKPPRQVSKQLLSTQLGFNINENKKDGEVVSYEILKTNLFPHEYTFISINTSEAHATVQSGLLKPELMNWFVKIISDGDIYESFDSLNLNISLYDLKATMDSENEVHLLPDSYKRLTYNLLDSFLMSIINEIAQPSVLKIAKIVTENYHFEDDKLVAKAITKRLKSHFEMIIEIMP